MTTPPTSIRTYEVHAETTRTFGRVLASARQHHFVVDGPVQNGCPGEEVTPAELFLGGVAACGAELIQVIAREEGVRVDHVAVDVTGTVDRSRQKHAGLTTFTAVDVEIVLSGADGAQAAALVEGFRRR
jgi:organic hydroperoxide reductase OsmC/OhrA